jgi:hypothetical protein
MIQNGKQERNVWYKDIDPQTVWTSREIWIRRTFDIQHEILMNFIEDKI